MEQTSKQFVCISCPMGCMLNVTNCGNSLEVTGNTCKRGEIYAINEYTNPVRTITTSIKINTKNGSKMISVKTDKEVPKTEIFNCLETIKKLSLEEENVKIGDVLIENINNFGVNIIATRAN